MTKLGQEIREAFLKPFLQRLGPLLAIALVLMLLSAFYHYTDIDPLSHAIESLVGSQ